ncbi:carbon-nitrogen hydrolase family protein [Herbiconiux sp. VKM Ac-1786]|uniref:carbon-nitrogen hydrolase family protein n=1 Tax=Herbiconiux sp. VKM Ac-1786 TaxID=2783824 RepID=UPI00188CF2D2|nr:carbon-nitrogen hydrolase family protein [Herbiconiux sp. VKM Ac-1786]MBF4573948.1 carbon-nitrogen hydrolase family protein [Herbiconiux sp. VKM Ac-1786]
MTAPGFGVAVAQFAPGDDTDANLAAIERLARRAAQRGASLVVFPEYSSFFVDPLGERMLEHAQPVDGPFVAALAALARELDVHLVAGLVATSAQEDRFANRLVAIDPVDGLVATYSKLHLYDAFGAQESDWVELGRIAEPETFSIQGVTIGLQTCYDIRFPEVTRRLVDAGADLVAVPAEWVRGPLKEHHWRSLVTARALENTIYVAAADQTPPIGVGASLVVDPMGVTIASLGEREDVAVAWVDPARIDEVRRVNPALALRRFDVVPRV